jgi:hypothetical protein
VGVVDASVSPSNRHPGPPAGGSGPTAQTWSIDAALLWEILVYEKAGYSSLSENLASVFGDTLLPDPASTTPEVETGQEAEHLAEFDLIGSEGIAGHKTVHKETPLHAPGQDVTLLQETGSSPPFSFGPHVAARDLSPSSLETAMGGNRGPQGFFLGAADAYNRTIDAWLDLDVVL